MAPNGVINAYTFYISFDNGSSIVLVDRTLTGTFILEGLLPYQLISVEVSANTSAGEGPKSNVDIIRTAQAAPSMPTGVMVQVTSNSSLMVRWNPPTRPNGILTNYTVRIYNVMNNYYSEFSLHPYDTRSISVDDLGKNRVLAIAIPYHFHYADPYVPYNVEVSAHTVAGESVASSQMIFTEHGGKKAHN